MAKSICGRCAHDSVGKSVRPLWDIEVGVEEIFEKYLSNSSLFSKGLRQMIRIRYTGIVPHTDKAKNWISIFQHRASPATMDLAEGSSECMPWLCAGLGPTPS